MTKICPICGVRNEAAVLNCQCGRELTAKIDALQQGEPFDPRRFGRKRIGKKIAALLGCLGVLLLFAAYVGGLFPTRGESEVETEDVPSRPVAEAKPSQIVSEMEPGVVRTVPPTPVFPEAGIAYKATRAISGARFAVTDSDGKEREVTIFGIRAPKANENFGVEAKEGLWTLIAGKPLLIKRLKFTREAENIAEVTVDSSNVGVELLRSGMAILVTDELLGLPATEQQQYMLAAQFAKKGKYGVWGGESLAASQPAPPTDETARSSVSPPTKVRRTGQGVRQTGTAFGPPDFAFEPTQGVVTVSSEGVEPKEQTPAAAVPAKTEAPPEPSKVVAAPSSEGRKYVRGPFGGCYYLNAKGRKNYVDRGKCESM